MSTFPRSRRGIVALAAAALALSPLVGVTSAHADPAPTPTHGINFDYFNDVYPNAGANSVFETVTLERFKYLLRDKSGNFAFFIGDPNDENAQATIGYINQVAKAQGITKIYNFTPKIDGGKWNLWNWNDLASVTGGAALTYWKNEGPGPSGTTAGNPNTYYSTHTDDYLNKDTNPQFVRTDGVINGPYLFVYNKDRQIDVAGTPTDDHIVSSLTDRKTAADLDTPAKVDAYKAQVADVLGAVPAASYATNTAFQFWKDEANRRHNTTYADASIYGGDILDDSDNADGFRVQPITYPEWIDLLKKPGDIPFLFGGTWCHNTRAIIKSVNKFAQQYGVKTVFNFDYSLFSTSNGSTNYDHSRASGTNITTGTAGVDQRLLYPSQVYGQTVNTYLTNAIAEYGKVGQVGASPNYYYPNGDLTKPVENAVRIQVGHFLTYNKDHVDSTGAPAPVVDQALRQNDNGGNTEYMTEWWYAKGKDLPVSDPSYRGSSAAGSNALANARAFAREGIDDIEQVFRGFTTSLPSTTTVTGVGSQVLKGASVTLNVALDAANFTPYASLNGASSSTAPGTLTAKPRGWVRLLDGNGAVVGTPKRVTRAGTTTFDLGAQSDVGTKSYTVQYLGRGNLIQASSQAVSFAVVKPTTTTSITGPSSIAAGAGGQFTATVTPSTATGTVTLSGLPGGAVTGTVSGGTATLDVPTSVPSGSYQVSASYGGDADNAGSETAAQTLQVVANPSTTTLSGPATTSFGAGGTFTATVTSGATGTVRLHGLGADIDATITGGTATFTVPAATVVGSRTVSAEYLGDSQYGSSVSEGQPFEVTKASTTTTLAGPASSAFGTARTFTATVTSGATGTVRLHGLASDVDATITGGTATFTVPATTPVGARTLRAEYLGNDSYSGSESAGSTYTVTKAAPSVVAAAATKVYGTAGKVTVTVNGVAGVKPTGTVKVTEGSTISATATLSGGTATVTLPKTASVKKHTLTVQYLGNGSFATASKTVSFTVTPGTAKAPTFKPTGTIKSTKAGTATVAVGTASGLATPTGKVKLTLKLGKTTKTVTATLVKGSVKAKLPKLAKGKWAVKVQYLGSTTYKVGTAKAFSLTVK